jgi:hypothetical protein
MKTAIITLIYSEFWGTEHFRKSAGRVGLPVYNAWQNPGRFTGHGNSLIYVYNKLQELKDEYTHAIYSDGADTLFLKHWEVPNRIVYSSEKAVWPPTPYYHKAWDDYYTTGLGKDVPRKGRWIYINGGNYSGSIPMMLEFFKRYGLINFANQDINGQDKHADAFFKAKQDGFPIHLDIDCEIFQTTGFEDPGDFSIENGKFKNNITGTYPCTLHGNGRTPMDRWYNQFNK